MATGDPLAGIQAWYATRCDGDWEHAYGLSIETVDNPGWAVRIDLAETPDAERAFERQETLGDENDWLVCWVEREGFHARCGPENLSEAIRVFLAWAST
jgi:hypothetical protein